MKKVIFFIALNCFVIFEVKSQGFTQIQQAPLLLNPSFAGSTGSARLALVSNVGARHGHLVQNNYASFDHLLQKSGIGYGGGLFTYRNTERDPDRSDSKFFDYQTYGGLFSVAPKYVLKSRDGKIKATLSPSLGLSYAQSNSFLIFDDYTQVERTLAPYSRFGTGLEVITDQLQFKKEIKASLSLLYNSENLILGLVVANKWFEKSYGIRKIQGDSNTLIQNPDNATYFQIQGLMNYDTTKSLFREYYWERQQDINIKSSMQVLDFHYSQIFRMGKSGFSFVPSVLSGLVYYSGNNKAVLYPYKLNFSVQLNYKKICIGGGNSSGLYADYLFAGYKTEKLKITGGYNFSRNGSNIQGAEVSVNYTI